MSTAVTESPRPIPAPDYALAGLCLALAFAAQLPFATHHAVLMDEGMLLQMGVDITNGKVPYRDGVHYAFPGVFYLAAFVFEIFGTSIETARILAAALFAFTTGTAVLICRWWCTRPETIFFFLLFLSYRVWTFPHWHMLNYSPLAVAMAVAAVWAAGEHLARTGYRWAIVAGLFCGLAILSKQDSGGAISIALGIAVLTLRPSDWRDRLGSAVAITVSATVVVLGMLVAVWNAGFLEDLIQGTIYGPLYGAANYEYLGRPALLPFLSQDSHLRENHFSYFPQVFMEAYGRRFLDSSLYRDTAVVDVATRLIYHGPWMIVVGAALTLIPKAPRGLGAVGLRRRMLVLLAAIAFLMAFNRPHDWVHLLVLYPPTLFLLASAIPLLRRHPVARALTGSLCIALFIASVHLAIEFHQRHSAPVETARGTFHTRPVLAAGFREVLAAIGKTAPDIPMLAYPYHPFMNFLADRAGPTRYLYLWPVEWNDKRDDEIIASLEARPDTTILYSLTQLTHLGPPRDFAPRIFRYLTDNYEIDRIYGIETPGLSFLQLRRELAPDRSSMERRIGNQGVVTKRPRNGTASELADGRENFLRVTEWPFRQIVALKTQPAAEVALRIPVDPQLGDRLSTSYATNPEHWEYLNPPPVRFRLAIAGEDGSERTLIEREIVPGSNPSQRRWFDVEIDLSPWAGQSVEIVLGVFTRWGTRPSFDIAGWEIPMIRGPNRASESGTPGPGIGTSPATANVQGRTTPGSAQPASPRGTP